MKVFNTIRCLFLAGLLMVSGAEAFAQNGAFLGCGADDANLGAETADMAGEILA